MLWGEGHGSFAENVILFKEKSGALMKQKLVYYRNYNTWLNAVFLVPP